MKWLSVFILLGALLIGLVFLYQPANFSYGAEDAVNNSSVADSLRAFASKLVGVDADDTPQKTINVLILGKAGAGWTAGELTDTILLVVLNGTEERGTLFSIPRDLYVEYRNGWQSKINTLWQNGKIEAEWNEQGGDIWEESDLIREEVFDITGIAPDEVIVVDVAAVERVIDEMGGIAIEVKEHLIDPRYPTPGGGTEPFEITPGFQVLDGPTAVKYARTRHTREGDFGRIRRQHQVIEAITAKARGLKLTSDFTIIIGILDGLKDHVSTTFSLEDMAQLAALSKNIPFSSINTFALESFKARREPGEPPILVGAGHSYALQPRKGFNNYEEVHEIVQELLTE